MSVNPVNTVNSGENYQNTVDQALAKDAIKVLESALLKVEGNPAEVKILEAKIRVATQELEYLESSPNNVLTHHQVRQLEHFIHNPFGQ